MYYSEHLAIQEAYNIRSREFLPPFGVMVGIAFSLHVLFLLVQAFLPEDRMEPVSLHTLNIRFGGAELATASSPASPKARDAAYDRVLQELSHSEVPRSYPVRRPPTPAATPSPRKRTVAPAAKPAPASQTVASLPDAAPAAGSALGSSATGRAEIIRRYEQLLSQWIQRHKLYPEGAQQQGMQGRVLVRVRINRQGHVQYSRVERTSGHDLLDRAALESVKRASPVPAVPEDYPGGALLEFLIPMQFELR